MTITCKLIKVHRTNSNDGFKFDIDCFYINKKIGAVRADTQDDVDCFLSWYQVEPRGMGLGKVAFPIVEKWFKQQKCHHILITALQEKKVLKFWRSLGFKKYTSKDWDSDEVMRKIIK